MYRALELYPLKDFDREEYIYHTQRVLRRFRSVKMEKKSLLLNRKYGLKLETYLDFAKKYHWDLSRDVNYAYAEVLYPPENILWRMQRVFGEDTSLWQGCTRLSRLIHKNVIVLWEAATYYKIRSAKGYARLMLAIMKLERQQGLDDALDFEE